MPRAFQRFRVTMSALRLLPHIGLVLASRNREIIQADIHYWAETLHLKEPGRPASLIPLFLLLMTFNPEFRNLFYLRTGRAAWPIRWMCPSLSSLQIDALHVGRGLFIQHGENTFISAESIGNYCWIGRHVVIGYSNTTDMPTIGNNVRIFPGAKIIGKINVGDNATIGLNTVVIDNVPPNVTLLGVPGRVVSPAFRAPSAEQDSARHNVTPIQAGSAHRF